MNQHRINSLGRCCNQIISKGTRQKRSITAVDEFFIQRRTDSRGKGPSNLAFGQARINDGSTVVGGDVFVDDHSSGIGVYFYATEIKGKAVGQRGVNFVVGRGGSEFRSAPVGSFPHGRFHIIRQAAG